MRSHPFRDLPEDLRHELTRGFPELADESDTADVLWLESHDFPRVRREDLATDHLRVVLSRRPWRISHPLGEDEVPALEPVVILKREEATGTAGRSRRPGTGAARRGLIVSSLIVAVAAVLAHGVPQAWRLLEARSAAPAAPPTWPDEASALRWLDSHENAADTSLRDWLAQHPSARVRAAAAARPIVDRGAGSRAAGPESRR